MSNAPNYIVTIKTQTLSEEQTGLKKGTLLRIAQVDILGFERPIASIASRIDPEFPESWRHATFEYKRSLDQERACSGILNAILLSTGASVAAGTTPEELASMALDPSRLPAILNDAKRLLCSPFTDIERGCSDHIDATLSKRHEAVAKAWVKDALAGVSSHSGPSPMEAHQIAHTTGSVMNSEGAWSSIKSVGSAVAAGLGAGGFAGAAGALVFGAGGLAGAAGALPFAALTPAILPFVAGGAAIGAILTAASSTFSAKKSATAAAKLHVAEGLALSRAQSTPNRSLEGAALLVAQACLGALSGGEPVASAMNSWTELDRRGVSSLKGLDDSMKGLDAAIDAAFDKGRAKLDDTQLLAAAKSLDSNARAILARLLEGDADSALLVAASAPMSSARSPSIAAPAASPPLGLQADSLSARLQVKRDLIEKAKESAASNVARPRA